MVFSMNDRVSLNQTALSLSYIERRKTYTNMYAGKAGRVIGFSSTGKIAVEFDDIVFTGTNDMRSGHDTGCHGKGKRRFCWYIPAEHLTLLGNTLLLLL